MSSIVIKNGANEGFSIVLVKSKFLQTTKRAAVLVLFVRFVIDAVRTVGEKGKLGNNDNDNSPGFELQLHSNVD